MPLQLVWVCLAHMTMLGPVGPAEGEVVLGESAEIKNKQVFTAKTQVKARGGAAGRKEGRFSGGRWQLWIGLAPAKCFGLLFCLKN